VRSSFFSVLIGLVALGSLGCHRQPVSTSARPTPGTASAEKKVQTVSHSQGRIYTVEKDIALVGTVVADRSVQVPSRATGQIVEVLVVEGDRVGAGQVLATVDTAASRLAVKQAEAQLAQQLAALGMSSVEDRLRGKDRIPSVIKAKAMMDNAKEVYDRYQGLHGEQLVSDVDLSNQRAAYIAAKADYEAAIEGVNQSLAAVKAAELAVEIAQQRVTEAVITAPFEGIVDTMTAAAGAYVSSGSDSGITLLKVRPLFVSLDIPQEQLSEFGVGEVLSFVCPGFPGRRLRASVTEVGAALNAKAGSLAARARVIDPPGWLQPGMAAEVQLETSRQPDQLLFPQAAVLTQAGKSSLFVVTSRSAKLATVEQRPVVLGVTVQDWVVIEKGEVKPEDTVVASDLLALKSGDKVELGDALTIAAPESFDEP
jgi:RND family efflux transporter MFP subunit